MRVEAARAGRKRQSFGCGAAMITGIVVLFLVSILAAGVVYVNPGGGSASASQIPTQPGSLAWNAGTSLTLLVLGTTSNGSQPDTTNTMMVLSVSPTARTIDVLSLPADLWVSIPGYGQDKVAAAYGDGGRRLAQLTVQSVLHVAVPYYLVGGGPALRRLVDAVGGVQLPIAAKVPSKSGASLHAVHLQSFDGAGALNYAAEAAAGSAATSTDRSQGLLRALLSQGLSADTLFRIPSILNDLSSSINTNFPYDRVSTLIHLISEIPSSHVRMTTLSPTNNTASPYVTNATNVLLPNWEQIGRSVRALFPQPALSLGPSVDVLNGTSMLGRAASLAGWLGQSGVRIHAVASAPTGTYPTTQVWVAQNAPPHVLKIAGIVATLLLAPLVRVPAHRAAHVTVLIGHNYQDLSQR